MTTHYDYDKQAWVANGQYIRCAHSRAVECTCYGKAHEGEQHECYAEGCGGIESMTAEDAHQRIRAILRTRIL